MHVGWSYLPLLSTDPYLLVDTLVWIDKNTYNRKWKFSEALKSLMSEAYPLFCVLTEPGLFYPKNNWRASNLCWRPYTPKCVCIHGRWFRPTLMLALLEQWFRRRREWVHLASSDQWQWLASSSVNCINSGSDEFKSVVLDLLHLRLDTCCIWRPNYPTNCNELHRDARIWWLSHCYTECGSNPSWMKRRDCRIPEAHNDSRRTLIPMTDNRYALNLTWRSDPPKMAFQSHLDYTACGRTDKKGVYCI